MNRSKVCKAESVDYPRRRRVWCVSVCVYVVPPHHTLRGKRVWSNSHAAFVFNTPQFLWRVNHRLSVSAFVF